MTHVGRLLRGKRLLRMLAYLSLRVRSRLVSSMGRRLRDFRLEVAAWWVLGPRLTLVRCGGCARRSASILLGLRSLLGYLSSFVSALLLHQVILSRCVEC